jgi:hypothetical protein
MITKFDVGDIVESPEGEVKIEAIAIEEEGLLYYCNKLKMEKVKRGKIMCFFENELTKK